MNALPVSRAKPAAISTMHTPGCGKSGQNHLVGAPNIREKTVFLSGFSHDYGNNP
jgi:hypothetical protein